MEEQHNRCCYCMRRLDSETLEHLIPNKINDKTKFDNCLDSNTVLNNKNGCFSNDFIKNRTKEYPPYPHAIACQNFVVSCGSKSHCNTGRRNKEIKSVV